ncbi:alkali-sensitive linkage protein 1 [Echria macrotheca]|uniref:Alkali-sensitive linkage protein 1 n=1 Tax=Echria macrotheca TaxID=438768 RepID=A0AAJ0F059_9PEZI|nr:alkali-sensitive linkage protein 1 [Echria macrotheca]
MLHQFLGGAVLGMLCLGVPATAGPLASPKRGLAFTPNTSFPQDNTIWTTKPSDLTWYYNYQPNPSSDFESVPQSEFEFVPMLWGTPSSPSDTTFLETVKKLKNKINITNVLSFNEPDGPFKYGGSNMDPDVAAEVWVRNLEPLRAMGIRVGLPACTGAPSGLAWLKLFLNSCSKVLSNGGPTRNCTFDFVTLHWYGGFEGLASHMGEYSATFPNKTMWITEYNLDHQDLMSTQSFYNTSAEYFDRLDFVERYSLFGAFRSHVSNVGPNAAMLSSDGQLTDIGAWYLGREGTGVQPTSGDGKSGGFRSSPSMMALAGAVIAAAAFRF